MFKKISAKIISSLPQIIALLFLTAFAVYGWTEPASPPPGGNAPPPVTLSTDQTITGLKTFKPSAGSAPFAVDSSKTGTVTNLNAEKVEGYKAKDLALGTTAGFVRIATQFYWGLGCFTTSCSAKSPGYCAEFDWSGLTNYSPNCAPGWSLLQLSQQSSNGWGTCVGDLGTTYICTKTFPGYCGNGIVESGETCDDGNTVNTAGNCSADCSRTNKFPASYMHACQGGGGWGYITPNQPSADQYCKEQGFSSAAQFSSYTCSACYYPYSVSYYDGSKWACSLGTSQLINVWCQ